MNNKERIIAFIVALLLVIFTNRVDAYFGNKKEMTEFMQKAPTEKNIKDWIKVGDEKNYEYTKKIDEKVDANNHVISTTLTDIKTSLRGIEVYLREKN